MKYTKEERVDIGCRVYNNEFTKREAMEKFGITETTVDNYIRLYRERNGLPARACTDNPLKSRAVLPRCVNTWGFREAVFTTGERI